ncbi:MAG: penicillin-binding protein, partial [Sinomicrobium sp.]|nr:penicillin-binding protein [Sinomicrobium sp.]
YNPIRRKDLVKNRRNTVLNQIYKNKYITKKERDSLQALDMNINFNPESHKEGLATYFRTYLKENFLEEWLDNNPKPEGGRYNLYLDGLKIYTTIDSRMQRYAEEAVAEHMKRLQAEFFVQNTPERNKTAPFLDLTAEEIKQTYEQAVKRSGRWRSMKKQGIPENEIRASFEKEIEMTVFDWEGERDTVMTPMDSIKYYKYFFRSGMMSMEPQTGFVKAWVGGINYKHFQYDHVRQGARQSGSTFKPFVYATAIDQLHLSPCDSLPDSMHCIEANKYGNVKPWCPKNSDGKYSERMRTLKDALANSINTITARLIDQVGPQHVVEMAKRLGISAEIPPAPSIALGTADISVYEMVGAYGTFVNEGVYVKPVTVMRIED